LGVLANENLDMTQQCALTAQKVNRTLGCIPSIVASRAREGILSLYPTLVRPPSGVLRPALEPSVQDRHGPIGVGPEEATKMIRGMEHLCCEERLRELGLFRLQKRRLWVDLVVAFQYLKGSCRKDGDNLFSKACCDRTRRNHFKLKEGRFRLDRRKTFFTLRVVKHWNGFPREVVEAPSLETFKVKLDRALSNLI